MKSFNSRLSYSLGNEDFSTERQALQIENVENDPVVVAITASGDRPLNLLSERCSKILSVDYNPVQNALLNLKKAAIQQLSYADYLAFLGITSSQDRLHTFNYLCKHAPSQSLSALFPYRSKIQKGIIYQGAVERMITVASLFIRSLRRKKVEALFSYSDIEEQAEFVEKQWHTLSWRALFKLAVNPYFSKFFLKDPGLYEHIGSDIHSTNHLYNRCHRSLTKFPVKENLILSLCFMGQIFEEGYPPYLQANQFAKIKKNLKKVEVFTSDINTFFSELESSTIDAFSLSDVASYLSQKEFEKLVQEMIRTAKPNGRFCMRQFLSSHVLPPHLAQHLKREPELEKKLEEEDRCFVYRFMVGSIVK